MGLSRTASRCRKCPFNDTCRNKRMEALGYLQEAGASTAESIAQPMLRETVNTIINGEVVKVYKDDIEKQIYKSLYSHLGLQYGG